MYSHGTCQLCDTCYRHFHLLACCHDKVAELVDDYYDVRHELVSQFGVELMAQILVVVFLQIACSCHFQQVVAVVHKGAEALERAHHLGHVGNDGLVVVVNLCHEVVGYWGVDAELHLLRVDEHKLQLVGVLLVEQ